MYSPYLRLSWSSTASASFLRLSGPRDSLLSGNGLRVASTDSLRSHLRRQDLLPVEIFGNVENYGNAADDSAEKLRACGKNRREAREPGAPLSGKRR